MLFVTQVTKTTSENTIFCVGFVTFDFDSSFIFKYRLPVAVVILVVPQSTLLSEKIREVSTV